MRITRSELLTAVVASSGKARASGSENYRGSLRTLEMLKNGLDMIATTH